MRNQTGYICIPTKNLQNNDFICEFDNHKVVNFHKILKLNFQLSTLWKLTPLNIWKLSTLWKLWKLTPKNDVSPHFPANSLFCANPRKFPRCGGISNPR